MSRTFEKPEAMVPKKFFRYVVKGAHFFNNQNRRSFTLAELVSFAYLKNQRMDRMDIVESMVSRALDELRGHGLFTKARNGRFYMNGRNAHRNGPSLSIDTPVEATASPSLRNSKETLSTSAGSSGTSSQPRRDKDENFTVSPLKRKISSSSEDSSSDSEEPTKSGESPMFSKLLKRRKGKETALPKFKQNSLSTESQSKTSLPLVPSFIPLELDGKTTAQKPDQDSTMPKLSLYIDDLKKNAFDMLDFGSGEDD